MTHIIALCGPKNSGKTTIASYMEEAIYNMGYNVEVTSFASGLKEMIWNFLDFQNVPDSIIYEMLYGNLKEIESKYLGNRSPRYFMQKFGTEFRDMIDKDLWINTTFNLIKNSPKTEIWIIDDLRFIHEAEKVLANNGVVVKIHREGIEIGEHQSEREFLSIKETFSVSNNAQIPQSAAKEIIKKCNQLNFLRME